MERKGKDLLPLTGDKVEVDGVYIDEDGHEQHLHRATAFSR